MAISKPKELTKGLSKIPPAPPRARKRQALYITIRPHWGVPITFKWNSQKCNLKFILALALTLSKSTQQSTEPRSDIRSQKKTSSVALLPPSSEVHRFVEAERAQTWRSHAGSWFHPCPSAGIAAGTWSWAIPYGPNVFTEHHEGLTDRESNTPWPHGNSEHPAPSSSLWGAVQCHRPTRSHPGCAPKLPALGN